MRTVLLVVGVLASGCVGEVTDLGGDDRTGSDLGDPTSEPEIPQPKVTGSFDKTTLATELAKTETVTLSLTSENDFAGTVTLSPGLVDGAGAALEGVEVTGPMSVTLAAGATETAQFEIKIPMNALGAKFDGSLKVDLMSSAPGSVSLPVTIDAVYTVDYIAGTGYDAIKHTNAGNVGDLTVKHGAILRFKNSDVIDHVIYAGGAFSNYHENTVSGGAPGRTYEISTAAIPAGSTGKLGCFNHTNETYSTYSVE